MGQPQLIEAPASGDNPRAHWPQDLQDEFNSAGDNGIVGSTLVSETLFLVVPFTRQGTWLVR